MDNTFRYNFNEDSSRKVTVKIELEIIDIQEGVIIETLLNSRATGLVIISEFVKKQEFKLKKIQRPMYLRNIDSTFNKEELIKNTVEVNIFCKEYRERTEIDVISSQKWSVVLEML